MEDISKLLLEHVDEYAIESMEKILIGTEPVRKHNKKRIQKKWVKRYGIKPVYETKKCKKIDVTYELIVEFCKKYNLPLPDEMLSMDVKLTGSLTTNYN